MYSVAVNCTSIDCTLNAPAGSPCRVHREGAGLQSSAPQESSPVAAATPPLEPVSSDAHPRTAHLVTHAVDQHQSGTHSAR